MMHLRRFAPLLLVPLVFQVALAAKAVVCVNQPTPASDTASTQMAGMDMSGAKSERDGSESNRSNQSPCNRPFGPAGCQALAVCASGALVPAQSARRELVRAVATVDVLSALAPPSRSTPPELPPPRA